MFLSIKWRKILLSLTLSLFIYGQLYAQSTEKFSLVLPQRKAPSFYNNINVLDSRSDTLNMGFIRKSIINIPSIVVPQQPLHVQFKNIVSALIDSTAKPRQLLIQLRQLAFAEVTGSLSEKGYFFFQAGLYTKEPEGYKLISTIDTVSKVSSGLDVTSALLKEGSKVVTDFVIQNLNKVHQEAPLYSYNDILKIDSIEKRKLELYTTTNFTDGLYRTYQSFCRQKPDAQIVVKGNQINDDISTPDGKGKLKKVNRGAVYAIIYNGQPYIATDFDYYLLRKYKDNFFFTGRAKVNAQTYEVILARAIMGRNGSLMAASSDLTFLTAIDHLNGNFIRLKKIEGIRINKGDDAY
jgi:hypothetical protein